MTLPEIIRHATQLFNLDGPVDRLIAGDWIEQQEGIDETVINLSAAVIRTGVSTLEITNHNQYSIQTEADYEIELGNGLGHGFGLGHLIEVGHGRGDGCGRITGAGNGSNQGYGSGVRNGSGAGLGAGHGSGAVFGAGNGSGLGHCVVSRATTQTMSN